MAAEAGTPSEAVDGVNERAHLAGPLVTVASAAVIGLAAFLPWLHTGHATRTSFQMMRAAELLDVVTGVGTFALRLWYFVPVLVALVWLAAALDRLRLMAVTAIVLAGAAASVAIVVLRSGLATGAGPQLALIGAVGSLVGAIITVRPFRRPSSSDPSDPPPEASEPPTPPPTWSPPPIAPPAPAPTPWSPPPPAMPAADLPGYTDQPMFMTPSAPPSASAPSV